MPRHTVQVLVSNVTSTVAHLQGLEFTELSYQCCVYADYNTYSPRACVFINNATEGDASGVSTETNYTSSLTTDYIIKTQNHTPDATKTVQESTVVLNNDRQSARTLVATGISLGLSILFCMVLSLASWSSTCYLYCRQRKIVTMNKEHQRLDKLLP